MADDLPELFIKKRSGKMTVNGREVMRQLSGLLGKKGAIDAMRFVVAAMKEMPKEKVIHAEEYLSLIDEAVEKVLQKQSQSKMSRIVDRFLQR